MNTIPAMSAHWLRGFNLAPSAAFRVDIDEDDKQYRIYAELPGAQKENVSINVDDNVLSINAKMTRANAAAVRSECARGDLSRAFLLPRQIQTDSIEASMKNGVLMLTLPKTKSNGRAIKIR